MFEKISYLIMRHLEFLGLLCQVSKKTLELAHLGEVEKVILESSNKDKLINILIGFHDQINQLIKQYHRDESSKSIHDLDSILKSWANESEEKIEYVRLLDEKILELLNLEKCKTQNDIQEVYLNRRKLSGYNLSSVK